MIIARHENNLPQTRSQDGSVDNVKGVGENSDAGGNLSPQNQAIVGAVVGGVVVIAITVGILFLLSKKQKWDRIRQREEALLTLHAPPVYDISNSSSHSSRNSSRNSSNRSRSLPPKKHLSSPFPFYQYQASGHIEEQPPAYETHSITAYDPSRYHHHHHHLLRPTSALTVNSGYLHHLTSEPGYGQPRSSHLSMPFRSYRHSIQGRTEARGMEPPAQRTEPSVLDSSSVPVDEGQGMRSPRKPKPVLARLVTNFG